MHWILVGIGIGIGLMLAPLIVSFAIGALPLIIVLACIGLAVLALQAHEGWLALLAISPIFILGAVSAWHEEAKEDIALQASLDRLNADIDAGKIVLAPSSISLTKDQSTFPLPAGPNRLGCTGRRVPVHPWSHANPQSGRILRATTVSIGPVTGDHMGLLFQLFTTQAPVEFWPK